MPINEIEDFGNYMRDLGTQYHYQPLTHWGARLHEQASMFEIDVLPQTLDLGANGNPNNYGVSDMVRPAADANLGTDDDQVPYESWTVYLVVDGGRQMPGQLTGSHGCYTVKSLSYVAYSMC